MISEEVQVAIYGAGGFGREIGWMLEESSHAFRHYTFLGYIDDDQVRRQRSGGTSVFTLLQMCEQFPEARVAIAVGNPMIREQLAMRVQSVGLAVETLVHQSVIRSPYVDIGRGSIICSGAVLTTDIVLGQHVHMNLNSTIGHDSYVGDFSTIGPGVTIAGFVRIGKRVFIGAGAVVINGRPEEPLLIGDDVVIGAGSCVIRSIVAGSHVFGNPARPIPVQYSK